MELTAAARRAGEVVRDGGLRALGWKVLGELCYRRIYLYVDDLNAPLDAPDARIPLEYGFLEESEIDEYLAMTPGADAAEVERRLAADHECVTGRYEGRLVGYCWSGAVRAPLTYLGVDLLLEPGWVYGYEMLVDPTVRRQRVSVGVLRARRRLLAEKGHRYELTGVMPENTPAFGFQRIMGRKRAGTMRTAWFGPLKRTWADLTDVEPRPVFETAPMAQGA